MSALLVVASRDLPKAAAIFAALERRTSDLSPLMDRIGMALEASTDQRFEDEESPAGVPWKPSLRAQKEGGKTLTDTPRLRPSITHRAGRDQVEVGTNVIYASTHQDGAVIRPKSAKALRFKLPGGLGFVTVSEVIIPARPFLGDSSDDRAEIAFLAEDYLLEVTE